MASISPVAPFLLARAQSGMMLRPVVVTIHGAAGPCLQLSALEMFKLKGKDQISFLSPDSSREFGDQGPSVISYRYQFCSKTLREHGEDFAGVLHDLKTHARDNPLAPPSHFLTYGYGALILREAFTLLDWDDIPSNVVMIAPPNRGVSMLRSLRRSLNIGWMRKLFPCPALRELVEWGPDDIERRLGPLPQRCKGVVIASATGWNPLISGAGPQTIHSSGSIQRQRRRDREANVSLGPSQNSSTPHSAFEGEELVLGPDKRNDFSVSVDETYLPSFHHHEVIHCLPFLPLLHTRSLQLVNQYLLPRREEEEG